MGAGDADDEFVAADTGATAAAVAAVRDCIEDGPRDRRARQELQTESDAGHPGKC